jgi:hypothetical protein
MKSEFLQPRFEGPRFSEHTLPLEVARDLAAYETLVVELAKHLYIQEHPERQRVPKGFAADFHLHLERVDDGSARPLLSIVTAGALALGAGANIYFERARELISACVAAPEGQLPPEFPRELLVHFNQVGRSLRADESVELPRPGGAIAVLTPDRRKHLVLAAEKVYEREIELSGTIGEADWEKSTFRLRLADESHAVVPMPESFHAQARKFGGRERYQVTVKGIATYDSWDKLQKVISVDSLEIQPDYQLAARFDALLALADGWLDGRGIAPDKTKLAAIAEKMVGQYPDQLPLPAIAPTPEGNLLLEWDAPGDPSVDLHLDSMRAAFHAFQPGDAETEHEIPLTTAASWGEFFSYQNERLRQRPA